MNANELAEWVEDDSVVDIMLTSQEHYRGLVATMLRQQQAEYYSLLVNHDKLYAKVIEQQAEIEALKNGFNTTWAGTNNSEMAEVRAMANRCILKIQELEFEQEGFENLVEMLESEKEELVEKTRQQQAEIERLIGAKPITYGMLTFCKNCGEQNPYQSKTLTDEEIIEIWSGMETDTGEQNIAFARAILRKAQENE